LSPRRTDWPLTASRKVTLAQTLGAQLKKEYSVVWEPPFKEDVSEEAEEFPLSKAVTMKRLETD
jgi:hypothetical protein